MDHADHRREQGWSYSIRTLSPNLGDVDDVNLLQEGLKCDRRQTESGISRNDRLTLIELDGF